VLGKGAVDAFTAGAPARGVLGSTTGAAVVGGGEAPDTSAVGGKSRGGALYNKLLTAFRNSNLKGVVPPGGEQFGIKTGSPEEWAKFGVSVAHSESGFDPKVKNLSDPGGSFGVFQYAHNQVPGGNAYDVDASVKAFVRDSEKSAVDPKGLRGGILGRRFSTIGKHPGAGAAFLGGAEKIAQGEDQTIADRGMIDKRSVKTVKVDAAGSVKVNIAGGEGDATLGSKGLFKPTESDRPTQMAVAKTGPPEATAPAPAP
jgi:hypothetical protein